MAEGRRGGGAKGRRAGRAKGRKGAGAEGRRGGLCVFCLGVSRFVSTVRFLFLSYIHFVHYFVKSIPVNLAASRSSDPRCWSITLNQDYSWYQPGTKTIITN